MEERDKDPLLEVSHSIADDADVNWEQEEAAAATVEDKEKIKAAQLVARIHRAHRRLPIEEAGPAESDSPEPNIGTWGRMELRAKIGGGATAEVYRAFDPQLRREVALKLLDSAAGPETLRRVTREARLSARVESRHVAHVYGVEEHDGRVGIVMELVRGQTLRDIVLQSGRRGAREAALIGMDLCRALAAVHGEGVLHRDIKAQNVMRAEGGRYVLVDFGIGQESDNAPRQRSTSGTPLYLAPEVLDGAAASVQSDLYGLGVLLFYLVCADFPVTGASVTEIRAAHRYGRRQLLRDLCPDVPPAFVALVERAVAPDPEERFGSVGEMEQELRALIQPSDPGFQPNSSPRRRGRRWAVPLGIAATVLLVIVLGLRIYPQDLVSRSLLAQAEQARWKGNFSLAAALATSALRIEALDPLALMTLEICSRAEGNLEKAARLSAKAYKHRKPEDVVVTAKVEARYALNRLEMVEFERHLDNVLARDPTDPDAPRWLTLAALEIGDYETALRYAELTEERSFVEDPVGRGLVPLVLAQWGKGGEALGELNWLTQQWVGPPPPYFDWIRGFALLVMGETDQALEVFDRLARSEPAYATNASFFKAQAYVLQGNLEAAELELSQGAGLDREAESTGARNRKLFLLHEVLLLQGRPVEANSTLERIVPPSVDLPAVAPSIRDVAVLLAQEGKLDRSRELQDRLEAISRDQDGIGPIDRMAVQVQAEILMAEERWEKAGSAVREALDGRRDVSQLFTELRFLLATGRSSEAGPRLEELRRLKGLLLHDYPATWWLFLLQEA